MSNATLDEQLAIREATAWYPWKSDGVGQPETVRGEVVGLDSVWSDYASEFRIIAVIRDDDGELWSVRSYPSRLHDEWLRLQPQLGERVAVKFAGMRERKKDSKSYPDFALAVEREAPAKFDYSRIDAEASSDGIERPLIREQILELDAPTI